MNNLLDIQNQIDKLQKQAEDIKKRDFNKTVTEILEKMNAFGITAKDLSPNKRLRSKAKAGAKPVRAKKAAQPVGHHRVPVASKFKGPNGESWSGRGLMPRWLSALVADGRSKDEFAVKN